MNRHNAIVNALRTQLNSHAHYEIKTGIKRELGGANYE